MATTTVPVEEPQPEPSPTFQYPTTWRSSLSHWWSSFHSSTSTDTAEHKLLRRGLEPAGIPLVVEDESGSSTEIASQTLAGGKVATLRKVYLPPAPDHSSQSHCVTKKSSETSSTTSSQPILPVPVTDFKKDKDRYLNVLEIGTPRSENDSATQEEHPILVMHGYGGGAAFWWQNLDALSSFPNTRVYVLDWLGMGKSGRPRFPHPKVGRQIEYAWDIDRPSQLRLFGMRMGGQVKADPKTFTAVRQRVEQAEAFFLDSLEQFRQTLPEALRSQKMTLIGHSLGGYLSTAYAIRYPQHVHKLILASPVGVPESPYEMNYKDDPASEEATQKQVALELEQSQMEAMAGQEPSSPPPAAAAHLAGAKRKNSNDSANANSRNVEAPAVEEPKKSPPKTWWTYLWEQNVSPFTLVRYSNIYGPKLVSHYAQRRFGAFPAETQQELFTYLYDICCLRGSGEYCLAHLLAPGAYARHPLVNRFHDVRCPTTFIYGEHDWMDVKGGLKVIEAIKHKNVDSPTNGPPMTSAELKRQRKESKVVQNKKAGHWVFLENPRSFDKIMKKELAEAVESWKVKKEATLSQGGQS